MMMLLGRVHVTNRVRCDVVRRAPKSSLGGSRQAVSEVRDAMKSNDTGRLRQATELLKEATIHLSEAVKRGATEREADVIDAEEFEETHRSRRKLN
jgi:hypothetical protein